MEDAIKMQVLQQIMKEMRMRDGASLMKKAAPPEPMEDKPKMLPDGDEELGEGLDEKGEDGSPGMEGGLPKAEDMDEDELAELVQMLQAKAAG